MILLDDSILYYTTTTTTIIIVKVVSNTTTHSPVQRARKFSAVLGTTSARNVMTTRPAGLPPMVISK